MRYNILTYHIGEGIRNLFKNKKSTISSLVIMMATMLMFGIFFIIGQNVNYIMKTIDEDQGMQVFIIKDANIEEVEEIKGMISNIDGVATTEIFTKQDAFDQMKAKFKDHADVIDRYGVDIFPDSIIVKLTDLEKSAEVQEQIKQIKINDKDYIDEIRSSDKTINALINIANGVKIITGVLLILLVAISVFIISNTIKLTVHARRKEISIMKYVGATNAFIRWPFIVEGIIIGILSAIFTILVIYGGYTIIIQKIIQSMAQAHISVSLLSFNDLYKTILIVYFGLGIGIGIVGSSISMRKYLEV